MALKAYNCLIFCLAYFGTASIASTVPHSHCIHEKRDVHSSQWVKRDRVEPNATFPMRIGLTQSNLVRGPEYLADVSDPESPNYAKHWTQEEIIAAFAPSQTSIDAVRNWLIDAGIHETRLTHSDNKGWFAFDATAEEAERLLHAEFYHYQHLETRAHVPSCDVYHVPRDIQEHLDYITPGVRLLAPLKKSRAVRRKQHPHGRHPHRDDLKTCDVVITPACIRALYKIPPPDCAVPGNSLGMFEESNYYDQADLDLFFRNYTPHIPQGTHPTPAFIDGAEAPGPEDMAGSESTLDMMLAYPLIYPQEITLYQTDDQYYASNTSVTYTGGFNTFLDALDGSYCTYSAYGETGNNPEYDPVYPDTADPSGDGYKGKLQCGVYKPTNVISISYGGQEADISVPYQKRQCNEYLKLGLAGVSIFFASGDAGVAGLPSNFGGNDFDNGCIGTNGSVFNPTWPNNCPWVTNVGGTKVYPGKTVFEPESAVVDALGYLNFSSGGGFSNVHPIPDYQKHAVETFFKDHPPAYPYYSGFFYENATGAFFNNSFGGNGGIYNRAGRGIPDIAANADNIATYLGGEFDTDGGTSASTPIVASIFNRINGQRILAGKKPVGFINPALYANPSMLNDITNGTNPGCGTPGFSAVKGWDPVTGLGTPNYPRMLEYFLSLP